MLLVRYPPAHLGGPRCCGGWQHRHLRHEFWKVVPNSEQTIKLPASIRSERDLLETYKWRPRKVPAANDPANAGATAEPLASEGHTDANATRSLYVHAHPDT
jgi:hypothetical protein